MIIKELDPYFATNGIHPLRQMVSTFATNGIRPLCVLSGAQRQVKFGIIKNQRVGIFVPVEAEQIA